MCAGPLSPCSPGRGSARNPPSTGLPLRLASPFGDCDPAVARLMSVATTVRMAKALGVKVFISRELGEDGVDAAFAGGADGVLEELQFSRGGYGEGARFVLLEPRNVEELVNTVRNVAETVHKPFDVLVATTLEDAGDFAPYVDGLVLVGGWVPAEVEEVGELPEVGRCLHCGIDYLMYGGGIRRCVYCGRRLSRVVTSVKPPRSRAVFRSVYKKYANLTRLRFKVV